MNIWRPFTQMQGFKKMPCVSKTTGCELILENDESLIDGISSWWVINHGHCHPHIVKAIQNQVTNLDQVLFGNFSHLSAEKLANELRTWLPSSLEHMFFSDNGSTGVEVALKMVAQFWQQVSETASNRNIFLTFKKSYHGDTVGAMSVSGKSLFTDPYKDLLFRVIQVDQGVYSFDEEESYINPFLNALEENCDRVAGVIIEPLIQGAGGMVIWPVAAVNRILSECKVAGIPVIFDEVMTGFGRTGSFFAFNQLNRDPDIICLSKGLTGGSLPLSLTVTTNKIYEAFLDRSKSKMFFHGHSFTGNPISCAAAVASLQVFQKESYKAKWAMINRVQRERINVLRKFSSIKDGRVCGTMGAIEMISKSGYQSNIAESLTRFAFERGVFLRPLGNIIYCMPPYCISEQQLHKIWDVISDFVTTG